MEFISDVQILEWYEYDLLNKFDYSDSSLLQNIMDLVDDDELYYYYNSTNFIISRDFVKKIDSALKFQIKDGINKYIHALYLIYFVLLRITYGNQTPRDICVTEYILMTMPEYCYYNDYMLLIPLSYINKLYEIAKKDVAKYLKVSIDTFPKDIPDEWILNNFIKYEWITNYIRSHLISEEKIYQFENLYFYSTYYEKHWLDKKLPEVEFDF